MEDTTTELLASTSSDAMREWSEQRRKDFVHMYSQRADAAIAILVRTAERLHEAAVRRFIYPQRATFSSDVHVSHYGTHGDRKWDEIEQVATKRADAIFGELPQVKKALEIVNHDVFELMEKKDKVVKSGTDKLKKLNDLSQTVALSELDQDMTIREFRKYAEERESMRKRLVRELNDLAEEGNALEAKIHKALFKGIPGLKEAVEVAIDAQMARVKGFEQLKRRVQEKVLFGDSEAAQELLQHFKDDEVELDVDVKKQIAEALAKMNLVKKTKALKGKA
jgi:hypothetical protein